MNSMDAYAKNVGTCLARIHDEQREALETAALWLSETITHSGLIYVTGSGHSHMLAEEAFYRAGGLMNVHPLLEPAVMLHTGALKSSQYERLEGVANIMIANTSMNARDVLIIASNSGRNAFSIEAALAAKERNCRVIAITSVTPAKNLTSRHSSERRLFEVADLVIDSCVPAGDASVRIAGLEQAMGPLSSIAGVFILNSMLLRASELCVAQGVTPDVFISANVDTPASTQQQAALARWRERIQQL